MKRLKILEIAALIFATQIMSLAIISLQAQPRTVQSTGRLTGMVMDINEARVPRAKVSIEGEGATRTAVTEEDGTYQIELPTGTYRIKVESIGFCPVRRAAFRIQSSTDMMLNFTLIPCTLANKLTIVDGQYRGEVDRYIDPFKKEVFPITHSSGAPLELLVRYGQRRKDKNILEYQGAVVSYNEHADNPEGSVRRDKYEGVMISYDALMIRADKVRLNPKTFRLEAEGNVIVEDGKQRTHAKSAKVEFKAGEPIIRLTR